MAASAALSTTNLNSQAFWNIHNLINSRTNVVDPVDASGSRKFVYAHEPDLGRNFANYPCVIVTPVEIKVDVKRTGNRTGDDKNAGVEGNCLVIIKSSDSSQKKSTAAAPHGMGLAYLDQISDDIFETFQSKTNRDTLRGYSMGSVETEAASSDFSEVEGEMVYVKEIRIRFRTELMAVSS